jgi:PIN domain
VHEPELLAVGVLETADVAELMIVLDTNVVSELMRPAPDPGVLAWVGRQVDGELYTTAITLAEIRYGIERLPDSRRKKLLRATADEAFGGFEAQVLPSMRGQRCGTRRSCRAATVRAGRSMASTRRSRRSAASTRLG